jgi:hypothetical protein
MLAGCREPCCAPANRNTGPRFGCCVTNASTVTSVRFCGTAASREPGKKGGDVDNRSA